MSVKVGNITNIAPSGSVAAQKAQRFKNLANAYKEPTEESYSQWAVLADQNKKLENTDLSANNYSQWADAPAYQGTGTVKRLSSSGGNNTVSPITEGEGETKGTGGTETGYSVWADVETETEPKTETASADDSFAKWLEADPAYQAALKQAQGDYDRALATYGAQGEALARSGLVGSGYSQWADAQAYAQMQNAKQNAFDTGYAKWLNEKQLAETAKSEASALFQYVQNNGGTEITDADFAFFKGLGYSDEVISAAQTALADYKAKSEAQAKQNFSDSLTKFNTDGDATAFLAANGISTVKEDGTAMSDEEIASAVQSAVEDAFKNGKISPEERSAHYKSDLMINIDSVNISDSIESVAEKVNTALGGAIDKKDYLTPTDYSEILKASYDAIGVQSVKLGSEGDKHGNVSITVKINGVTRTYEADWGGEGRAKKETENALNQTYGDASLALHNGKVYYQYEDGKWTQIKTKMGSPGSTAEGNDILAVVAAYYGDNKLTANFAEGNLAPDALGKTYK